MSAKGGQDCERAEAMPSILKASRMASNRPRSVAALAAAGFGFYKTTEKHPLSHLGDRHLTIGGAYVAIQALAVTGLDSRCWPGALPRTSRPCASHVAPERYGGRPVSPSVQPIFSQVRSESEYASRLGPRRSSCGNSISR
jgi:hypothetical protein